MADLSIQGEVVVNSEKAESAFDRVGDRASQMANEVATSANKAGQAVDKIGDGADKGAEKFTRAEARMRDSIKKSTRELEMMGKTASQKFEANLEFKGLDKAKFQPFLNELRQAEEATKRAENGINSMSATAQMAGRAMALAFSGAAITGFLGKVVAVQREFDVLNSSLKTVTGSSAAAEREMAWLKDFAKETPFGLAQATQGFVKMKALGLDPTRAALTSFGNTASAMGKDLNQMIEAVADASTGEFERLKEFGIKAKKEGDNVSLTFQGVTTTIKNSAAEITQYLENIGNVSFGGAMEERAKTLDGTIAALGDTWDELFRTVSTNNVGSLIFDSVTLANGALEDATTLLRAMGGAAQDASRDTGALSTIQNGIATVFETVAVLGANLKFVLVGIGTEIGGLAAQVAQAAQFNFAGVRAIREQMVADAEAARREIDATTERILNARKAQEEYARWATRNASAATDPRRVDLGGSTTRKPVAGVDSKGINAANKELADQAKLIAELNGLTGSFAKEWDTLSAVYKKGEMSLEQLTSAQAALLSKQPAIKAFADEQNKAQQSLAKANLDAAQAREKYITSLSTGLDKIQADIAAQIEATERMGLSKQAIADLDAAKLEMLATDLELQAIKAMDRNLDQQTYDALKKQAAAYRELGIAKKGGAAKEAALDMEKANAEAAKKAQEDWERAAEQINSSLTDALLRGFESGKDFAKNLRDTVVNMFKTMVLRPVISAIINPISGALTGMMGLSGAAQAATGGAGALSTVGSIGSGVSMLSGLGAFGGGLAGGFGGLMGSLGMSATGATFGGAMSAGSIAMGAGNIAGGLGTLAGALGPIALAVGLLSSLIKKSTPHMGAASSYSEAGGLVSNADIYQNVGFRDARTYNAEAASVTGGVAKAIGDALNSTARAFGKTAGYEITTAFADDKSKDGAWGSLIVKQMGQAVLDWRDTQTSEWAPKEFADGEAGQKEYMQAISISARDALKTAIGEVEWATDMLDALGDSPSLEGLAQTVDQINAASVALGKMRQNLDGFGGLTESAVSALVKAAGGMDSLIASASSYYDNFYSDSEKIANTTRDVSDALSAVGLQMPTTRDEFRKLVEAQMALGESGATAVAALLGVSGAFASITAATISAQAAERSDRISAQRAADKAQAEALQQQIDAYSDGADAFNTLRDSLLKAGDAAGLLAAVTERAFADPSGTAPRWGANSTAASFNYQYGLQQAAMRQSLSNELSASALRVQNIGGALGGLSVSSMMGQDDPVVRAVYIGMRDAIVQAAGDAGFAVRDAVDGAALYAAQAQVRGQFSATGPGLASVYAAREAYGVASSNTDVKVYEDAQRKLNGALSSGAIGADQFARALQALNDTLPQAAALSGDFDAQAARAAAALDELAQTGLRSIGYYFGQLNTMALELAKMEEPINATIASIGRLNSFEAAFGVSADAAGATGLSSLQIDRAQLIAEAAGIASAAMTTADAAAAAAKLAQSPAFAELGAKGIRDAALLLDGVGEYNADGFERAFIRISDALAKGSVTEGQYKALFDTALDMFQGVPEETRTLIDSMTRLRDAMGGFADGLLIDERRTTLSAGATLAEMQRQYAQAFAGAATGDSEAIGKYQQLATTLLDKDLYSTRAEYNAAFGSVYGDARQLENIGINTLANAQGSEMVSELKDMNAKLNKRVEDLEKNLMAALAQIAKNTSDTSRGIEQQIVMAEETP